MNVHQNARLTPHSRADLVRRVVVKGQMPKAVAAAFGVTVKALVGFRVLGLPHATKAATSAPSRALPRRRALCTIWKKPR